MPEEIIVPASTEATDNESVQNNLYFYRLENWDEVKKSLNLLIENEDLLLQSNDAIIDKMFNFASPLFLNGTFYEASNVFDAADIASASFLSPLLIKEFIKNPTDKILCDRLVVHLSLAGAATQNMPKPDFKPYNLSEMIKILVDGNKDIYNNVTFLYTLRIILDSEGPDDRAAAVFSTFEPLDTTVEEPTLYFWEEALEFNLMLHIIWKNFVLFGTQQQEIILKNYLFSAIVAGVPVEYWLKEILTADVEGFDNEKANSFFLKTIENSNERIPTNTVTEESRKLMEILPEYIGKIFSGDIKTLTQEKFIEDFYKGQVAEKKFSEWLRNLLQLYYNLRNGTYLRK